MLTVSIDRHAGAGWEDWSGYVFPVTDVSTESQARAGSGPSSIRFVDPPAIPLKNWGFRVEDDGEVLFEGLIDGVKHSDEGQPGSPVVHVITAGDYSDLLEFDVVPRVWRSAVETDKERITWLIETFGTHGVTCGDEVQEVIGLMPGGADGRPEQEFGPSSLAEAIGVVLKLTGGQVYVDYQKRAHHFIDETITAPFNLSDDPNGTTTREYFDFTLDEDNVTKVDEVVVFGAQLAEGAGLLTVTRTAPDAPAAEYRRRVPLVDDKLTSIALAEAAGDAYLQVHRGRRSGTLQTIYPGLLGGQTVQITHAAHGLTAEPFRIHSVKPAVDTPDSAVYAVAFGDAPPSQVDIIAGTGGLASQAAAAAAQATDASRRFADLSVGGANLVANSSFGSAILATWTAGAQWVFGYSPVDPQVAMWGSKTARATLAAATAGELLTGPIPVYRLDDYWATVWTFLRARTSGTVRIELREYDWGDTLLASTIIADLTAVEADYTAHRIRMGPNNELGRTGFDAATVAVRLAISTTGVSTLTCDVGGVQIERGKLATAYAPTPQELADGSIDAATKLIAYSIVAGLVATHTLTGDKMVAKTLTADEIDTNTLTADKMLIGGARSALIDNPSFESGPIGVAGTVAGWGVDQGADGSVYVDLAACHSGRRGVTMWAASSGAVAHIVSSSFPVAAGEYVNVSLWLAAGSDTPNMGAYVRWSDSSGTVFASDLIYGGGVSAGWAQVSGKFAAPAGAAYGCIWVQNLCGPRTALWVDDVQVSYSQALVNQDGNVLITRAGVAITNGKLTVNSGVPGSGTVIIDGTSDMLKIATKGSLGPIAGPNVGSVTIVGDYPNGLTSPPAHQGFANDYWYGQLPHILVGGAGDVLDIIQLDAWIVSGNQTEVTAKYTSKVNRSGGAWSVSFFIFKEARI